MQIVPVIDLRRGQVVRGIGGRRDEYRPIVSALVNGSEPAAVAQALVSQFSPTDIYVADLEAIETGEPDIACWRAIADAGVRLWIDAGISSPHRARFVAETLQRAGISGCPVIGLESVNALDSLEELRKAAGAGAIFSLDLRDGIPLARNASDAQLSSFDWATAAVRAGFQRLIVLDLTDVGTGRGASTLKICRAIKEEFPRVELIAGGGVRHLQDLHELAEAGCSAALVASSLHDGRITRDDWEAAATI